MQVFAGNVHWEKQENRSCAKLGLVKCFSNTELVNRRKKISRKTVLYVCALCYTDRLHRKDVDGIYTKL